MSSYVRALIELRHDLAVRLRMLTLHLLRLLGLPLVVTWVAALAAVRGHWVGWAVLGAAALLVALLLRRASAALEVELDFWRVRLATLVSHGEHAGAVEDEHEDEVRDTRMLRVAHGMVTSSAAAVVALGAPQLSFALACLSGALAWSDWTTMPLRFATCATVFLGSGVLRLMVMQQLRRECGPAPLPAFLRRLGAAG